MGTSMSMSQTPQRDQEEPLSSGRVQFSFLRNHGNNFPKEEGLLWNEDRDNEILGTGTHKATHISPKVRRCCGHKNPSPVCPGGLDSWAGAPPSGHCLGVHQALRPLNPLKETKMLPFNSVIIIIIIGINLFKMLFGISHLHNLPFLMLIILFRFFKENRKIRGSYQPTSKDIT